MRAHRALIAILVLIPLAQVCFMISANEPPAEAQATKPLAKGLSPKEELATFRVAKGFDLSNSEQLIDGLQWGLDNWVYGCAGTAGGSVRSVEKPDQPAVALHGQGVRFHPEQPGSLEPTSGGGQYGLAADDWQQWFV